MNTGAAHARSLLARRRAPGEAQVQNGGMTDAHRPPRAPQVSQPPRPETPVDAGPEAPRLSWRVRLVAALVAGAMASAAVGLLLWLTMPFPEDTPGYAAGLLVAAFIGASLVALRAAPAALRGQPLSRRDAIKFGLLAYACAMLLWPITMAVTSLPSVWAGGPIPCIRMWGSQPCPHGYSEMHEYGALFDAACFWYYPAGPFVFALLLPVGLLLGASVFWAWGRVMNLQHAAAEGTRPRRGSAGH